MEEIIKTSKCMLLIHILDEFYYKFNIKLIHLINQKNVMVFKI